MTQRYMAAERRYLAIKEEVKGRAAALDEAVSQSAQVRHMEHGQEQRTVLLCQRMKLLNCLGFMRLSCCLSRSHNHNIVQHHKFS